VGFGINLLSGALFFAHDPFQYAFNLSFRLKLFLIGAAGLNAIWFRLQQSRMESALAKMIAALSLGLWLGVIIAGRFIAFTAQP